MEKKSDNREIGTNKRSEGLQEPINYENNKDLKRLYYMLIISQLLIQSFIIMNYIFFHSSYKFHLSDVNHYEFILLIIIEFGTGGFSLLITFVVLLYSSVHVIHFEEKKYRKIVFISFLCIVISGGAIFLVFSLIPGYI
jgi:hypothetical protein